MSTSPPFLIACALLVVGSLILTRFPRTIAPLLLTAGALAILGRRVDPLTELANLRAAIYDSLPSVPWAKPEYDLTLYCSDVAQPFPGRHSTLLVQPENCFSQWLQLPKYGADQWDINVSTASVDVVFLLTDGRTQPEVLTAGIKQNLSFNASVRAMRFRNTTGQPLVVVVRYTS